MRRASRSVLDPIFPWQTITRQTLASRTKNGIRQVKAKPLPSTMSEAAMARVVDRVLGPF
jgi:hypothetical protein